MKNLQKQFIFKEIDSEGFETLKVISDAYHFNDWTYQTVKPYCSGKILEIGSGIGNISTRFIDDGFSITLSDIRDNYRKFLHEQFPTHANLESVVNLDLVHPDFEIVYSHLKGVFDTVFALNVVEHIENDNHAVQNCSYLLKPGGTLIILVPAFQSLYNNFDKELFHYRRYRRNTLAQLFTFNKLEIKDAFYFNAGGIPGWFFSGFIQKNKTIPASQMKIYDTLVPVFKIIDKVLFRRIGLSVICVGKKPL
ncbi:MAG: methyltransferase domain-containing protein [Bacteroidetes bacterium]|nr:methyltransferase domain-containing protein [Bacteroidota bacterium]